MYHLFLDDERHPKQVTWIKLPYANYQIVRSYNQSVDYVESFGVPEFVTFDHDLADQHYAAMLDEVNGKHNVDYGPEKTGYECAKWLVDYCERKGCRFPDYMVHSMNPIGSKRIRDYVENAKKHLPI